MPVETAPGTTACLRQNSTVMFVYRRPFPDVTPVGRLARCPQALKVREQGRLVVYVTTMGIVRPTYQQCQRVRQILRQLMAEFEERDLFLSVDHQQELQRRLGADQVTPPQVFIDGHLLGVSRHLDRRCS